MRASMTKPEVDVIIVGAGLSGIGAAYYLQHKSPERSFTLLEARERLGGTWDLFRYPGIRSDSDMYTFGFQFHPWKNPKAIADGPSILAYLRETAETYGIDRKIEYRKRVVRARWSSAESLWTVDVEDRATGKTEERTCRFLYVCAGYYEYEKGYTPEFPGRDRFQGTVIHPQHWPEAFDYANKRIVIIGSGATAVTLLPELAKKAAHVTMLQRSPTYVVSRPEQDPLARAISKVLPASVVYRAARWKNVGIGMAFYAYCRKFPERAKGLLVGAARKELGRGVDASHFTPRYDPWTQRVCAVPDGDLFAAVREGRASVVTDTIETFTEKGIRLASGKELEADVIVTATGFTLKFLGGAEVFVDGRKLEIKDTMVYRGMMLSGVPNLAFAVGYTNASWTLKTDLTGQYVCRLLNHMAAHGKTSVRAVQDDPSVEPQPILDFSSGYVLRSIDAVPKQGSKAPWKLYQNYVLDTLTLRGTKIEDGVLRFE
jgi:cation diffusion facilitator CzcD-associated flavoprotein CzcO